MSGVLVYQNAREVALRPGFGARVMLAGWGGLGSCLGARGKRLAAEEGKVAEMAETLNADSYTLPAAMACRWLAAYYAQDAQATQFLHAFHRGPCRPATHP